MLNEWLVRTAQNLIAGPYTQEQIVQLIRDGQLSLQDEICPANGYWIFLHEREEVRRLLSIDLPRSMSPGAEEEITETQTESTAPGFQPSAEGALPGTPGAGLQALEPMPADMSDGEQTSMLSTAALRSFRQGSGSEVPSQLPPATTVVASGTTVRSQPQAHAHAHGPAQPQATVVRGIERPSAFKGVAWALFVGALAVLYLVLRTMHQ